MSYIAADFPGTIIIDLIQGDELFFRTSPLGWSGPGQFGGVVSDVSFDEVRIWYFDNQVNIDNIHFGPPIPAPGAIVGVAALALLGRRRRRT
jgi:MYXO-CTERM domain-containing protein